MIDGPPLRSLNIDVSGALPSVGDRKRVDGSAELRVSEGFEIDFFPGDDLRWSLELRRIAGAVEVAGDVVGEVTLTCFRCLESFSFSVSIKLREHALWLTGDTGEQAEEAAPDYVVSDGMLDLEPILRDSVALAFPVRRVCDESCKGLCVRCGANLNLEPCGCDVRPVDVRLSPLAELKKKLEGGAR